MGDYGFKLLGNINADSLIKKVNDIYEKGWNQYCFDPGPPWNKMNKIQSLDMIILFSLPEKQNLVLQKLIYNKELLNLFKDDIREVSEIFDQHYVNKQPKRITLNNMRANSVIPEHKDFLYHYENTIRIHVPIITNENVVFNFPTIDKSLHMKVGEIIEFNNNIIHSGYNKSEENRIHLIIDYGEKDDPYYGEVDYDWNNYL
jgi:hypothetical protein